MDHLHPNPSSELLQSYLDGELDPEREQSLFAELNGNSELRSEMRELIAVRQAVREDREAFAPPAAATNAVFAALGFTSPLAVPSDTPAAPQPPAPSAPTQGGSAAAGGIMGGVGAFLSKIWLPALSTVLVSVGTGALVWNHSSSELERSRGEIENLRGSIARMEAREAARDAARSAERATGIAGASGSGLVPGSNATAVNGAGRERIVVRYVPVVQKNPAAATEAPGQELLASSELGSTRIASASLREKEAMFGGLESFDRTEREAEFAVIKGEPSEPLPSLIAEIRGISSSSYPNPSTAPGTGPALNNTALRLAMPLSARFSLGVEIGQENFGQEFLGIENKQLKKFQQNPSLFWAGLSAQYTSPELFSGVALFGRGIVGTTSLGPVGRALMGVMYSPAKNLNMMLGAEGALLQYESQNSVYYTRKMGVTYGVSMNF